jgi:hypothetical protein
MTHPKFIQISTHVVGEVAEVIALDVNGNVWAFSSVHMKWTQLGSTE